MKRCDLNKRYELNLKVKDFYFSKSIRLIRSINGSKSQEGIGLRWTTYALIRLFQKAWISDFPEDKFYGN